MATRILGSLHAYFLIEATIARLGKHAMMQASPPQGFPFFGMPPSVLPALCHTDPRVPLSSSTLDGIRSLLASAKQQAAASGRHPGSFAGTLVCLAKGALAFSQGTVHTAVVAIASCLLWTLV